MSDPIRIDEWFRKYWRRPEDPTDSSTCTIGGIVYPCETVEIIEDDRATETERHTGQAE